MQSRSRAAEHDVKNSGGGVTLNGKPIDLRHLLHGNASRAPPADGRVAEEGGERSATSQLSFSLDQRRRSPGGDDGSATAARVAPAILNSAREAGRSAYRKARRAVYNLVARPRGGSAAGGLTPVATGNDAAASSSLNDAANRSSHQARDELTQRSSLAGSPATPLFLKFLLPPLLLANHVVFYHAQVSKQPALHVA